jgi:hypothetical protein
MAAEPIATKQVEELRHLIEGAAKNLVERVYGPRGPEWGTRFAEIEEVAIQVGQALSREMCDRALQQQAAEPVPVVDQVCPTCGKASQAQDPVPRVVKTRAGDARWEEPQTYCRSCRRAFFPSVETAGD